MFRMTDEKGGDDKIICVPAGDPRQENLRELEDIPEFYRLEIHHFLAECTRSWSPARRGPDLRSGRAFGRRGARSKRPGRATGAGRVSAGRRPEASVAAGGPTAGGPAGASVAAGRRPGLSVPLESHRKSTRRRRGTLSGCCSSRPSQADPRSWYRCGTAGCWSRRLPSTAVRPSPDGPPTSATALRPGSGCSCAGTRTSSNFGAFGSPERRLVFDVNDFDNYMPGPFEWDVKHLVASLVVAARSSGFADTEGTRRVALHGRRAVPQGDARVRGVGHAAAAAGTPGSTSRTPSAGSNRSCPGARCEEVQGGGGQDPDPGQRPGDGPSSSRVVNGQRGDHRRPRR